MTYTKEQLDEQLDLVVEAFDALSEVIGFDDDEAVEDALRNYEDEKAILKAMKSENNLGQENSACKDDSTSKSGCIRLHPSECQLETDKPN